MDEKEPVVPATRIITLLESNDVSNSKTAGQWSNNLNENTILREGDSIFVRQSMVDTTTESSGTIDVSHDEADITIQFGMYLQDSGNGAQDGGDQQSIDYLDFSQPVPTGGEVSPSGRNFILQNHTRGLPNTEIWYTGGPTGLPNESENPGTSPANDFSISFVPSTGAGDWWEYVISTSAAAYAPPAGTPPFPPPSSGTGPIILPENLEGLKCIFKHGVTAIGAKYAYYNVYPEGWTPASGTPVSTDHIASIAVLYDNGPPATARPIGYVSEAQNTIDEPNPGVPANRKWVFQGAVIPVVGGTEQQFWNNVDPVTREESSIYRVCTEFRMIVDNYADIGSGAPPAKLPDAPYQTALSYTTLGQVKETVRINFSDWGNASLDSFGTGDDDDYGLFFLHIADAAQYKLPSLVKGGDRGKLGFGDSAGYSDDTQAVFWVNFQQLQDTRNPLQRTLQPFIFDVHDGITALPFSTSKNGRINHSPGAAMGIYNPRPGGVSNAKLAPEQITDVALPLPDADGVVLTPRIFTQKISIPAVTYTYEALAQELTDQFNKIPRIVPQLNNNPFPDPPQTVPTALNPVGFSGSRILSSTFELGMQQTNNATVADRVPTFPSEFTWSAGNPTAFPLKQPVWVDESGEFACQFNELSVQGEQNPRWIGAEALSFIYDQSSDTFQVAQAHSNMYSRLDGGIIARQFKVNDGDLVTADKAGGIFLTSLEPASLFFDKMKLQPHKILVSQLTGGPFMRNLKTGTLGASATDFDQNVNLDNALTHTVTLVKGDNITGNFVGLSSKIDKRVNTGTGASLIVGGNYGAVRTEFDLDVGVDAPITIKGLAINNQIQPDPFFQVEISGMNRQDVVGAATKNNLIQTIVGKYFSNGGFTTGSVEDGWKYTHVGEPLMLRSLNVRILDSTGNVSTGLGPNSAIILEIDTDK